MRERRERKEEKGRFLGWEGVLLLVLREVFDLNEDLMQKGFEYYGK